MTDMPVIDTKMFNKFALHKLANNGGSIKFQKFGINIVFNEKYPDSPMVELQLFAVPMNTAFSGNINPNLAKLEKTKIQANEQLRNKIRKEIEKEIRDENKRLALEKKNKAITSEVEEEETIIM